MVWSQGLSVEVGGQGVVCQVGTAAVRLLADRVGVTGRLSQALAGSRFAPVQDRGRVFTDLAVMIADGGTTLGEIAMLLHQDALFGPVASVPTGWRTRAEITPAALDRIAAARAAARGHGWEQIVARHGRIPPCPVAGGDLGDVVVIRWKASIVIAHSDEERAASTFKRTFGPHPLTAWCDHTGESLVIRLRPGNAGSTTAADHI